MRGVIGPESSNNAKEGGGLVPTLLFGIPGSGSMAIFISAIALLGTGSIEVGPSMLKNNLDFTYAIVWLLALANVVGTLICIAASGGIARLTAIRFALLAPFLFMIISFAAFQSNQDIMDLVALFAIGLLGILMRRFDWSRPAFLIGFVLSGPAERYTNQAYQIAASRFRRGFEEGIDYVFSPIVIVLIVITLVSVVFGLRQAKTIQAEGAVASGVQARAAGLPAGDRGLRRAVLWERGRHPGLCADGPGVPRLRGDRRAGGLRHPAGADDVAPRDPRPVRRPRGRPHEENAHGLWPTLAWFAGLLAATAVVGFVLALAGFLVLFIRRRAGKPPLRRPLCRRGHRVHLLHGLDAEPRLPARAAANARGSSVAAAMAPSGFCGWMATGSGQRSWPPRRSCWTPRGPC